MRQLPRVVIDTNVFVSAVLNQYGMPRRIVDAWERNQFTLLIAPSLLAEASDVLHRPHLRDRHRLSDTDLSMFFLRVLANGDVVTPLSPLPLNSRDPKDDQFLAVALGGNADYLVTGDDDLLSLRGASELGKLRIVTAREFVDIVDIMG
jgi:putative PIN family toxin of toxin-antitoxin system